MNVIILKGVHLGEGCIIQAGSLDHKEVPPYKIAGDIQQKCLVLEIWTII